MIKTSLRLVYILFCLGAWGALSAPAVVVARDVVGTQDAAHYLPFDEAHRHPGFSHFRSRLLDIIERRDRDALVGILSSGILNSFGGNGGIDEFREMWQLDSPVSDIWNELSQVLSLGGCYIPDAETATGSFYAPYLWCVVTRSDDADDCCSSALITGSGVAIRESPTVKSALLQRLRYQDVEVIDWQPIADIDLHDSLLWIQVRLNDGRHGYVASQYVRSWVDYRAGFSNRSGRWQLEMFVAGD